MMNCIVLSISKWRNLQLKLF